MFEIDNIVVNASNGICRIKDRVELDMSGENKPYFLLVPIGEETAKVFIPVDSADKRIRMIIEESQAKDILDGISDVEEIVVTNEKEREAKYKEAVKSCEPMQLIALLKCLVHRKKERFAQGKKTTAVDERYSKIAENNLFSELAYVMGKSKDDVSELVFDRIE